MEAELLKFLKHKEETKEALKSYVVNKKIPLEFRWNLFNKSKLGDTRGYYEDFKNLDDGVYAELEYNRYNYVHLNGLVELLEKRLSYEKYLRKSNDKQTKEEVIIELKEEILSKFLKAFIFDW